jgi:hypothetical protein
MVRVMARTNQKDILSRLSDISETAIQKLADAPGADRFMGTVNTMRDRLDELQRRVRGLEGLEQRIEALEKKVAKLTKSQSSSGRSTTSAHKKTSTEASKKT